MCLLCNAYSFFAISFYFLVSSIFFYFLFSHHCTKFETTNDNNNKCRRRRRNKMLIVSSWSFKWTVQVHVLFVRNCAQTFGSLCSLISEQKQLLSAFINCLCITLFHSMASRCLSFIFFQFFFCPFFISSFLPSLKSIVSMRFGIICVAD